MPDFPFIVDKLKQKMRLQKLLNEIQSLLTQFEDTIRNAQQKRFDCGISSSLRDPIAFKEIPFRRGFPERIIEITRDAANFPGGIEICGRNFNLALFVSALCMVVFSTIYWKRLLVSLSGTTRADKIQTATNI